MLIFYFFYRYCTCFFDTNKTSTTIFYSFCTVVSLSFGDCLKKVFGMICSAKRITGHRVNHNGNLSYCSLVMFNEVFFVNKVHKKPENCGAKSCFAWFLCIAKRVTVNEVDSNESYIGYRLSKEILCNFHSSGYNKWK